MPDEQQQGSQSLSKRSSVVDRVKWIEKTHGTAIVAGSQPRARLRLPKHFVSAQQQAETTTSPSTSTPSSPLQTSPQVVGGTGLLLHSPRGSARLPPAMMQTASGSKVPTLGRRATDQMPSPVLSETSTIVVPTAAEPAISPSPSMSVIAASVGCDGNGDEASLLPAKETAEIAVGAIAEEEEEEEEEEEDKEEGLVSPQLSEPRNSPNTYVEPVEMLVVESQQPEVVADAIGEMTLEAKAEHPNTEATPHSMDAAQQHGRTHSDASSNSSNLTDPADPIHVNASSSARNSIIASGVDNETNPNGQQQQQQDLAVPKQYHGPSGSGGAGSYATLPRSTKFAAGGFKTPGLGSTRNRMQQAPRRYDRTTIARPGSSASACSGNNSDGSCSRHFRPTANNEPTSPKPKQPRSPTRDTEEQYGETTTSSSSSSSLLARLNGLSAARPQIQDLVSTRSSPKFANRSQFYSSPLPTDEHPGGPRNREQRRFR